MRTSLQTKLENQHEIIFEAGVWGVEVNIQLSQLSCVFQVFHSPQFCVLQVWGFLSALLLHQNTFKNWCANKVGCEKRPSVDVGQSLTSICPVTVSEHFSWRLFLLGSSYRKCWICFNSILTSQKVCLGQFSDSTLFLWCFTVKFLSLFWFSRSFISLKLLWKLLLSGELDLGNSQHVWKLTYTANRDLSEALHGRKTRSWQSDNIVCILGV